MYSTYCYFVINSLCYDILVQRQCEVARTPSAGHFPNYTQVPFTVLGEYR